MTDPRPQIAAPLHNLWVYQIVVNSPFPLGTEPGKIAAWVKSHISVTEILNDKVVERGLFQASPIVTPGN